MLVQWFVKTIKWRQIKVKRNVSKISTYHIEYMNTIQYKCRLSWWMIRWLRGRLSWYAWTKGRLTNGIVDEDGWFDGPLDGATELEGDSEGCKLYIPVDVGNALGCEDGLVDNVGFWEGNADGIPDKLGPSENWLDGREEKEGSVEGWCDNICDGPIVGCMDGAEEADGFWENCKNGFVEKLGPTLGWLDGMEDLVLEGLFDL